MRTALVIGGRPDYAGPAVRILPRTGARVYLSERWKVDDLINNNDLQQQLKASADVHQTPTHSPYLGPVQSTPYSFIMQRAFILQPKEYCLLCLQLCYWGDNLDIGRSTSGNVLMMSGARFANRSRLEKPVAMSSC